MENDQGIGSTMDECCSICSCSIEEQEENHEEAEKVVRFQLSDNVYVESALVLTHEDVDAVWWKRRDLKSFRRSFVKLQLQIEEFLFCDTASCAELMSSCIELNSSNNNRKRTLSDVTDTTKPPNNNLRKPAVVSRRWSTGTKNALVDRTNDRLLLRRSFTVASVDGEHEQGGVVQHALPITRQNHMDDRNENIDDKEVSTEETSSRATCKPTTNSSSSSTTADPSSTMSSFYQAWCDAATPNFPMVIYDIDENNVVDFDHRAPPRPPSSSFA